MLCASLPRHNALGSEEGLILSAVAKTTRSKDFHLAPHSLAQNLEVSLGGFALFDFQILNLFKAEPAFDDKYQTEFAIWTNGTIAGCFILPVIRLLRTRCSSLYSGKSL